MVKKIAAALIVLFGLLSTACDDEIFWGKEGPAPRFEKEKIKKPSQRFFYVTRDGFRFSNYTARIKSVDLTPRMVERLCGEDSCARGAGDTCVLSAAMEGFMENQNRIMGNGHCEGMNALAQAILVGHTEIASLDDKAQSTYELPFSSRVQEEIAFWFSTQSTIPARIYSKQTPNEILESISQLPNEFSIVVCRQKEDKRACHSLTPIRIINSKDNPNIKLINVYDSNFPGKTDRFILIDTLEDSFKYGLYFGQGLSNNMYIRPFSNRIVSQQCPTKGRENNSRQTVGEWHVTAHGPATVEVSKGVETFLRADAPPLYAVDPRADGATFLLKGQKEKSEEGVGFTVLSNGLSKTINAIQLDPGEIDEIQLGKDDDTITFKSSDGESLVVSFAATYEGADYVVELTPSSNVGFEFFAENRADENKGEHKLDVRAKIESKQKMSLKIELKRIGDIKDESFVHNRTIDLSSLETITIEYGKWLKDKQPLIFHRDIDGDGYYDREESLSDDN